MNYKLLLIALLLAAGIQTAQAQQTFSRQVGELHYDSTRDEPDFKICDTLRVLEYYNTRSYYRDHKREITQYLLEGFATRPEWTDQSGYLTVRFIINCKGQTGCFRLYQLDTAYQPAPFKKQLANTLQQLVESISGWQPAKLRDTPYDSYQYITFRLRKGKIISIAP
jgi:hypothetical protein